MKKTITLKLRHSKCPQLFCLVFLLMLTVGQISGLQAAPINKSAKYFDDIKVTGKVTSPDGETLIGVNIMIKGTTRGVTTNVQGQYTITAPSDGVLVFTYIGYKRKEVRIAGKTHIDLAMESDESSLNEVVVVGYGTVAKSDYTGSASSLKLTNVNENRVISVPEALQGKISGVRILNNTGEPGSGMTFNIRGATSVTGSNQPLIVIDGQAIESSAASTRGASAGADGGLEQSSVDPLAALNPSDIASIEVLKDASSIAIYGSRGANGVVLITTKSGKKGEDKVTYSTRFDMSMLPHEIPLLSSLDFMHFVDEARHNTGLDSTYSQMQIDSVANQPNTDWQSLIYHRALSQDHQLSFSGGNDKSTYLLGTDYSNQVGILKNTSYTKGSLRFNYNRTVSKKLTLDFRNFMSYGTRKGGQQSNSVGIPGSNVVLGALIFNPLLKSANVNNDDEGDDASFQNDPVIVTDKVLDRTNIANLISHMQLNYQIIPNLTYQLQAGVNAIYSLRQVYYPTGTFIGDNGPNGSATRGDAFNGNYNLQSLLTYKKVFAEKHSLNVVGGYEYTAWHTQTSNVTTKDFPTDALTYHLLQSGAAAGNTYTGDGDRALESEFGRLNYSYDKRYLLTLTGRYDGSTRLAPGHKGQFYPSIGLGWNVSNEKFFEKNLDFMSQFKIRGSWGISGNDAIAIGATQSKYANDYVVSGAGITPGFIISDFFQPNLRWEQTKQYNLGVDFGFMKDRLTLSVDAYDKTTNDLLINLSLPGSAGYSNYYTNVGEVTNKGIEFETNFNVLRGKLKWNIGGNFTINRNNVNNMGPLSILYGGAGYIAAGGVVLGQAIQVAKPGYPISSFWGYKSAGIYQTQAEIDGDPNIANDATKSTIKPGDVKWVDTNGDGQITDADKTIIGHPNPNFTYGFNTDLSYKRFSLNMSFLGSQGNQIINLNRWIIGANNASGNRNEMYDAYNGRWTGPGTSNLYPALTFVNIRMKTRFTDWMVEDASFFRLQTVTLNYTFRLPQYSLGNVRVFLSGTNLFTITKYKGYDPNINGFAGTKGQLAEGIDFGTLPQPRVFSAGLSVDF